MASNKSHHFVPRFYLKLFSRDRRSIDLFKIARERTIARANLRQQCARDYFYGKDGKLEFSLAQLEGQCAQIIQRIIKAGDLPEEDSEDCQTLIFYILVQYYRTTYAAELVDDLTDKFWKQIIGPTGKFTQDQLDAVRVVQTDPAKYAINLVSTSHHLAFDLRWKLLLSPDGADFITSDNPVVFYNQFFYHRRIGSNTGIAKKASLEFRVGILRC